MDGIVLISGPSGVGKDTLIKRIISRNSDAEFLVPYTTRPRREYEKNGVDYFFISESDFKSRIKKGLILEWDFTLENYYGFVEPRNFERNQVLVTHCLSRMALRLKKRFPSLICIFIKPADFNVIMERLHKRGEGVDVAERIRHGEEEMKHSELFDYVVEDADTDILVNKVRKIISAGINNRYQFPLFNE